MTTYTVRAVVLEIGDEADHDLHLVMADLDDRRKTVIAEIVDPGGTGGVSVVKSLLFLPLLSHDTAPALG